MPTPAWSAESDQPTAELGFRVSGAGDVNGDSFDDVIVGAWRFDGGEEDEGRVLVYLGSASGLAATPAWTAESNQVLGQLGSVSTAGDVNADGFDDVLVGASDFGFNNHNDGRAFLYLGSAGGLGATPAWTAENGAVGTRFAFALSAAGDVNADGFGDVVVAAPNFFGAGKVYLYLGVPAGLVAEPSWSVQAPVANKDGGFGFSLSGAGDVNGDGRSDVIVGDPHYETPGSGHDLEGRALVYCGDPQRVTAFCFGDGQGTACPCGNSGASGHGCASSFDPTGALLQATGTASVGADSIVLHGSGLSNSVVSFFQGTQRVNGGAGAVFGDGLRCAGGTTVRLAAVLASANTAQYPNVGDQPVSVRGAIPPAGATRTYQIWYRNAASFCTSATYNLTNGVELVWVP